MSRSIELAKSGEPVSVVHRYNRDVWAHNYTAACESCNKTGQTVKVRKARLAKWRKTGAYS
jgi:hypothetical protein